MSSPISLTTQLPAAVLETILSRLAAFFLAGAGGDAAAARQAASAMLGAYHPETHEEVCLAANIISFSFQALEALAQAADPDTPMTRVLRLRSGAVSLSRESEKARRSLTQIQQARQLEVQPAEPQTRPNDATKTIVAAKPNGFIRTQTAADPEQEMRIAASIKRAEALVAATASPTTHGSQKAPVVIPQAPHVNGQIRDASNRA